MGQEAARLGLQESNYVAFVDVFSVLGILFRRECTIVGLATEFFNAFAELFSRPPVNDPLGNLRRETAIEAASSAFLGEIKTR